MNKENIEHNKRMALKIAEEIKDKIEPSRAESIATENKYLQLKKEIEKEINNFKSFFAFNEEQLKEGLKKLNCGKKDLISLDYGEFINKKDKEKYVKMWKGINQKEKDFLLNEENLFNALCYELGNHEFGYTNELEPTLNCLNLSYETLTEKQKAVLERATEKYYSEVEL